MLWKHAQFQPAAAVTSDNLKFPLASAREPAQNPWSCILSAETDRPTPPPVFIPLSTAHVPSPEHDPRLLEPPGANGWGITLLHWSILLLVAVAETWSLWAPALLAGHSAWMDLARMVEFDAAVRAGDYLPLWSPDFYHGYGSPLFQFYAPLAYYLTELPVLAGFDIPTSLKITMLVAVLGSGVAMYQLVAARLSPWAACLGGALYMVAPYRLVDIFVRHALAEHCAFLWLPLVALGTERFVARKSRIGLALGIVATAGLLLTHNVMALIGLPVCVTVGWLLGARNANWRDFLLAGLPALLGVGLSAFFWWPALSGRPLTYAEESLTGGYFDFRQHFVDTGRFLSLEWGFGESGPQAAEKMPLQIGWPHLLAGLAAAVALVRTIRFGSRPRPVELRWAAAGLVVLGGAVFMCHAASQGLWAALPLVKYVQFPWRFLALVVFGGALCGAAALHSLGALRPRWEKPAFAIGLIAVMAAYFPYYSEARFLALHAGQQKMVRVSSATLQAPETSQTFLPISGVVTVISMRVTGERATSSDDFLPRTVVQKPTQPAETLFSAPTGAISTAERTGQNRYQAQVNLREAGVVQLAQFWFPGWAALVDGHPAGTAPSGPLGLASCEVPGGQHALEFRYLGLPQRRTAGLVSWACLALCLLAIVLAPSLRPKVEAAG